MHACPTGAITEGSFDRTKCIRNYMLNGKIMPEAYRHYIGTDGGAKGILGCDICQRVCPINAPIEEQRQDAEAFTLHELLTCNKETLTRFAALYGRNYAIRNRIVAQAVLAAANQQDERQTRVITELQRSLSPAIQEHAIWAIRETTKNVK